MTDLTADLLAQLDAEQELAELAAPGPWRVNAEMDEVLAEDGITVAEGFALSGRQLRNTVLHIADHHPERTLRQIEAVRHVVQLHGIVHRDIIWLEDGAETTAELLVCGLCVPKNSAYRRRKDVPEGPCATVRHLAQAWQP
ncbi:DUF6221 family protein [[Kitasatospora] papulosa]|uniref:DUF6221 family protein n=1 Tax=[Kitasatospora] papulosa TaxID=1464011 RepID=UPI0037221BBF